MTVRWLNFKNMRNCKKLQSMKNIENKSDQ